MVRLVAITAEALWHMAVTRTRRLDLILTRLAGDQTLRLTPSVGCLPVSRPVCALRGGRPPLGLRGGGARASLQGGPLHRAPLQPRESGERAEARRQGEAPLGGRVAGGAVRAAD